MGMFTLLKKKTYTNPPDFKTRFRRWYIENSSSGRNSQIPWYQHINFLCVCFLPIIGFAIGFYVMPMVFL